MATPVRSDEPMVTLRTAHPISRPSKRAKVDFDDMVLGAAGIASLVLLALILAKFALLATMPMP